MALQLLVNDSDNAIFLALKSVSTFVLHYRPITKYCLEEM